MINPNESTINMASETNDFEDNHELSDQELDVVSGGVSGEDIGRAFGRAQATPGKFAFNVAKGFAKGFSGKWAE